MGIEAIGLQLGLTNGVCRMRCDGLLLVSMTDPYQCVRGIKKKTIMELRGGYNDLIW